MVTSNTEGRVYNQTYLTYVDTWHNKNSAQSLHTTVKVMFTLTQSQILWTQTNIPQGL